ncbi:UNVERIFIED_CONTAM: Xanthine dehydrogenase 1 [Sesamum latifolium]|uniref:Xanthine dehydrogenase 1 n=1 Tax=Sesamum latifolium TaxID=2727402 RepID=A0AAW2XYL1_9LAMI
MISSTQVGFTNDGKILALDLELFNNAGNSLDPSLAVLERAMFHSDNVYEIPNVRIKGKVCFTNFPSNTAFRGFGAPQSMLIAENWIQRISVEVQKSPEEIRAGALVQVYTDETVLVTHGGVEMGQGLHTKMAQVAASSFNIPLSSVFISETSTDKLAYACYMERIDLSAHGFYKTPDIGFDWATGKGVPYRYFTYGAVFAEVEIDTLTGDFHTRRADVILDLGFSLNPAIDVGQEINFQREGSVLHYGQQIEHFTLERLWNELKASCNFLSACKEVEQFNLQNRWRKRGVAIVPTKFGISFTAKFMNQAGALVQVYTDGTVLVTHGGVEMGQGLHTKVAQVAASSFGIPLSSVFISETSTDKVPNASPTAASASSDLYGAAVLDACEQIKARMEPMASKHNFGSFAELANACYMERIDLSAHGFYKTPDIGFDWATGKGVPFMYFTYGAAFAEVEIDTLTGDFHTRHADVIMDLGFSLNPAIDVGQIEGAFVQGLGWVALEELKWGDAATIWDAPNDKAIHSSKAVGEPPFFLASAVFFAIKDAIIAARAEEGLTGWFPLDNPATPERIRMACIDEFTKPFIDSHFRPKLSV